MERKYKIIIFLQLFVIMFLIGFLTGSGRIAIEGAQEQNYQTQIIYDETVNETQKICINNMIKDIDENMLSRVNSMTFTNDIEKYPFLIGQGKNIRDDIYIVISDLDLGLRVLICHEILHSWVKGDGEEELVDYLSKAYVPCFPTLFRSYILDDCSLELEEGFAKDGQSEGEKK